MMCRRLVLATLATLIAMLAACVAPSPSEPGVAIGAIQGGRIATGDPSVGVVEMDDVGATCTGALIGPDVVLTAAHCAREHVTAFYTGNTPATRVRHEVLGSEVPADFPGRCGEGLDVGLVHLASPALGIVPATIADEAPEEGASCRAVGLGTHPLEDGGVERGVKRQATSTVDQVLPNVIVAAAGDGIADKGDSGGPLFCGDRIIGVASCHRDGAGEAHQKELYARVDRARSWIETVRARWR